MRSEIELLSIKIIELLLHLVRLIAFIYFLRQTRLYNRFQGDQKDPYTILTFFFLSLSMFGLMMNGISIILETFWNAWISNSDDDFNDNSIIIRLFRGIMRPGMGYLFQNLAFLVNIERWNIILTGRSTANSESFAQGRADSLSEQIY